MITKKYSKFAINNFAKALVGEDRSKRNLIANNYHELAALVDAFKDENQSAIRFLVDHDYQVLLAFYFVIENKEQKPFDFLLKNYRELAAISDAAFGNRQAFDWLKNYSEGHYVYLAKVVISLKSRNRGSVYAGSISFGGGIGSGGFGGFDGFGGGSFGGGGAGGSW